MTSISKFWRDFCVEHQVSPTALEGAFAFGANSRDADILSDLVKVELRRQRLACILRKKMYRL